MNDHDSVALEVIRKWKSRSYLTECQSEAALHSLIVEALTEEHNLGAEQYMKLLSKEVVL